MTIKTLLFMTILGLSACTQVPTDSSKKTNTKPQSNTQNIAPDTAKPNAANTDQAADKYAAISGEYEGIHNTEKSMASATIAYIGDNKIKFELVTATESGCVGEVEGVAIIGTDGIATYSAKDCQLLTFKFDSPKLSITEEHCDLHGARCDFEGEYLKAK
jgi:hypothetical protein